MTTVKRRSWPSIGLLVLSLLWLLVCVGYYPVLQRHDWLAIVLAGLGLIVALAVALWTVQEQRRQLQLNFALKIWEVWSGPEMLNSRNAAWELLRNEPFVNGYKQLGRLRKTDSATYQHLARLDHFLADLHDFLQADMLALVDVSALFGDTLQAYYCQLPFVYIGDAFAINDRTGNEQQAWFKAKVLGLAGLLKLQEPEQFERYGALLTDNRKRAQQSLTSKQPVPAAAVD